MSGTPIRQPTTPTTPKSTSRVQIAASPSPVPPASSPQQTPKPAVSFPTLTSFHDANFPRDPEGRVYHLGVARGEGTEI